MDWDKIQEECPKAFKLWKEGHFYYRTQQYFRLIYDFFDRQGIYVNVMKDWDFRGLDEDDDFYITTQTGFISEVVYEGLRYTYNENEYDANSRSDAEIKAFTRAFTILENKLNKECIC